MSEINSLISWKLLYLTMVELYTDCFRVAGPHKISLDNVSSARTLLFVMLFAAGDQ